MNYQDKYEALKADLADKLEDYRRSTLGMNDVEREHFTELWIMSCKAWMIKLDANDKKELNDEL